MISSLYWRKYMCYTCQLQKIMYSWRELHRIFHKTSLSDKGQNKVNGNDYYILWAGMMTRANSCYNTPNHSSGCRPEECFLPLQDFPYFLHQQPLLLLVGGM